MNGKIEELGDIHKKDDWFLAKLESSWANARPTFRIFIMALPHGTCNNKNFRWEKPKPGWVKLNFDEDAKGNLDRASCSGVFRDV